MNKNLCFLNFLEDEMVDEVKEIKISILKSAQVPQTLDNTQNHTVAIFSDDIEAKIVADDENIENIIILNRIKQDKVNEKNAKFLMLRCFLITKSIMSVIMQNRGCRIWIVHCLDYDLKKASYTNVIQNSLKAGFLSLTRVFALEMAKRSVNINFVGIKTISSWINFVRLIEDLRNCSPFNLTAQEIQLEE